MNFGAPLSVRNYCQANGVNFGTLVRAERFPEVERLCRRLMKEIARVVPILPVALISSVLLDAPGEKLDILAVEERAGQLQNQLQACGAPVIEMSRSTRTGVVADAVDFLLLRKLVTARDDKISMVPEEEPVLRYYANAIIHWREPKEMQGVTDFA